jgi:ribonuclease BN (tRNA processing enzyme)
VPGPQLAALRKAGTDVMEPYEAPLLAYTGDTTIEGVVSNPAFLEVPVLLIECTHMGDPDEAVEPAEAAEGHSQEHHHSHSHHDHSRSPDDARSQGHIHIAHLVEHQAAFARVGTLVLVHFSERYRTATGSTDLINRLIDKAGFDGVTRAKIVPFC